MKKYLLFIIAVTLISTFGFSCIMTFEPSYISGNLGDLKVFKITIVKEHGAKCTLDSMDDYHFEFENAQVTGYTDWEQVSYDTYEKYFQISLSETGNGSVKIWKDCSKEGYDEKVLKISIDNNLSLTSSLMNGDFPLETDLSTENFKIYEFDIAETAILNELENGLTLYEELELFPGEYYAVYSEDFNSAIAVFNDHFLYRFDHYIAYYRE